MSMPIEPPPDDRAERMARDPSRYYGDAWERSKAEVIAERAARPASGRFRRKPYPRPTPGIVQVRARGVSEEDLDRFAAALMAHGFKVWANDRKTYQHDDGVLCRYLTVEVPEDAT